jgi:molybdopterin-guanine dinucleotide biosynthesis protein A
MGQDKALIPVGKVPLLLRVCRVAQQCTEQVYVVTPWVERYQGLLAASEPSVHLIRETPSPGIAAHGPLIGFLQSLPQVQSEWILLLACDLPNLQADVLQQWRAALPPQKEIIACLPRHPGGWWEPLCGFYRSKCRASLTAFMQAGGQSFQQWLSHQPVQELPLTDPEMLLNCNTPDDLRQVE